MNAKRKTNNYFSKLLNLPVYVNILVVLVLLAAMLYAVLKGVDIYTNHGKGVVVPDVRGLQIEQAEPFFKQKMLKYVVVDSTYEKDVTPGAIVEMTPGANSKVKQNRVIYLTVKAKTEKKIAVPDLKDISYREAFAKLHSLGFTDIEIKFISGAYRNNTVGIQYGGQMLQGGVRVPINAKLILVIEDGDSPQSHDSTNVNSREIEVDNSWF